MQGAEDLRGVKYLFFHLPIMLALNKWVDGNEEDCVRSNTGGAEQRSTRAPNASGSQPGMTTSMPCTHLYMQYLGTAIFRIV